MLKIMSVLAMCMAEAIGMADAAAPQLQGRVWEGDVPPPAQSANEYEQQSAVVLIVTFKV